MGNPLTYYFLQMTVAMMPPSVQDRVKVLNLALGPSTGNVTYVHPCPSMAGFETHDAFAAAILLAIQEGKSGEGELCHTTFTSSTTDSRALAAAVPTITLPDLVATLGLPGIDLLKVDCEGCEFAVLPDILGADDVAGELHWHALEPEPGRGQQRAHGTTEFNSKTELKELLARNGVVVP